ncbi:phospholipid transport system substrate-binding protein [Cognatiyoonia koreensis]|uniref:Phospholipid transport system substrate-binding protein n=1 Tax=Cognatiyoonia koreensis TaxID=364200 RepID=A0A1I0RF63_9RHOB|nr:ABC transporter substrate-binding protein [Cognatiyoonia koreensis]SEW39327.1 phospholipid transport system substrate-binding protein [Cognatiyoonia koreensis]
MAITRRSFLAGTAAAACMPDIAGATTTEAGQRLVTALVADVNAVIASGASEASMIQSFAAIFDKYSDVPTIARYCLGADARATSASEMAAYTAAFRNYIATKYGRRFREFVGGQIVVVGASPVKSWIEVETSVVLRSRQPFRMDWHVSDRSGRDAFFNFIIEGVNMLLTERAEIGAMLDREGRSIAGLINRMNAI